jgi:hypothetical protein
MAIQQIKRMSDFSISGSGSGVTTGSRPVVRDPLDQPVCVAVSGQRGALAERLAQQHLVPPRPGRLEHVQTSSFSASIGNPLIFSD